MSAFCRAPLDKSSRLKCLNRVTKNGRCELHSGVKIPEEVQIIYCRRATRAEVKFGYGGNHYKYFTHGEATKSDGSLKKWLVCKDSGLRYYR